MAFLWWCLLAGIKQNISAKLTTLGGIFKQDFPNDRISLRFQLLFNQVKADDFKSGNIQQLNRNLSFKSSVVEFGPVLEIDFFKFHPGQNNTAKAAFGTPYFMGGIKSCV